MRTKLWTFVLAVAMLGFVMGGLSLSLRSASTSAAASSGGTTHLDFLVKFIGQDTFLDLGAPGPSQGDEEILHDLVFSPDGRTQVGYDGGSCVLFDVAKPVVNCTLPYSLPVGYITPQFLNSPPTAKIFAVTCVTGTFRIVRGP